MRYHQFQAGESQFGTLYQTPMLMQRAQDSTEPTRVFAASVPRREANRGPMPAFRNKQN